LVLNQNGFIVDGLPEKDYLSKVKSKINNKKIYKLSDEKEWEIANFQKIYEEKIDLTKKEVSKTEEQSENEQP